jgi:hypothetical protein
VSAAAFALTRASQQNPTFKMAQDLTNFLQWQANRRTELEEQKRFRDDALGYLHLLIFVAMRK